MSKKPSLKTLQTKADKLLQQLGRKTHTKCLTCGNPMYACHHYYPKKFCASLRYDWKNLAPICIGCHTSHHRAYNPEIHRVIGIKWGEERLEELWHKKRKPFPTPTRKYYEDIINRLEKVI